MLSVSDLSAYYGEARALGGVDLTVADGELVSVVGPNGAGKTTLVRAVSGLLADRSGQIEIDGGDLLRVPGRRVCEHGIAVVPEGRRLFAGMSVEDNLVLGGYRRSARAHRDERLGRVHELFPILRERAGQRA